MIARVCKSGRVGSHKPGSPPWSVGVESDIDLGLSMAASAVAPTLERARVPFNSVLCSALRCFAEHQSLNDVHGWLARTGVHGTSNILP